MSTSDIATTTPRAEWRKPPPNPARKRDPDRLPPFPLPLKIGERKMYRRSEIDHFKNCLQAAALGRAYPPKPEPPAGDPLVSHRRVAEEFDTTTRTIDRWVEEARAAKFPEIA